MLASATSKWGRNGEERVALRRVRTGPKCPEGNRRKLTWDSNLNCEIAREREKINWPEHTAGCSQNKGTEQFQRRSSWRRTDPSPTRGRRQGGEERGKLGPRDSTPYQTANRLPVSNQRRPEILDGRHPPGGLRLEANSWEQTQGTSDWSARKLRLGPRRGEGAPHRGECTCQAPGCLSCSGGEGTKRRPNWVRAFVEYRKTGIARNSGPAPYRAAGSLSSVDGESTRAVEWGQTQCDGNAASAPHTRQWHSSAVPLPPHSTTEQVNLNKRPPPPACVRVENRHWRDLQAEAK